MLRIKQGDIKYHFMNLWYDSTWDLTPVSRAIREHSIHYANIILLETIRRNHVTSTHVVAKFRILYLKIIVMEENTQSDIWYI